MADTRPKLPIVYMAQSAYFPNAVVVELSCGHRHVRPHSMGLKLGEEFPCCFCEDEANDEPTAR